MGRKLNNHKLEIVRDTTKNNNLLPTLKFSNTNLITKQICVLCEQMYELLLAFALNYSKTQEYLNLTLTQQI